jgi:hypothetical protein
VVTGGDASEPGAEVAGAATAGAEEAGAEEAGAEAAGATTAVVFVLVAPFSGSDSWVATGLRAGAPPCRSLIAAMRSPLRIPAVSGI